MNKCDRCGNAIPEPDLEEAIALEADWRNWREEHPLEVMLEPDERVLICIPCADELEEL
jgi:hypothetical protein